MFNYDLFILMERTSPYDSSKAFLNSSISSYTRQHLYEMSGSSGHNAFIAPNISPFQNEAKYYIQNSIPYSACNVSNNGNEFHWSTALPSLNNNYT